MASGSHQKDGNTNSYNSSEAWRDTNVGEDDMDVDDKSSASVDDDDSTGFNGAQSSVTSGGYKKNVIQPGNFQYKGASAGNTNSPSARSVSEAKDRTSSGSESWTPGVNLNQQSKDDLQGIQNYQQLTTHVPMDVDRAKGKTYRIQHSQDGQRGAPPLYSQESSPGGDSWDDGKFSKSRREELPPVTKQPVSQGVDAFGRTTGLMAAPVAEDTDLNKGAKADSALKYPLTAWTSFKICVTKVTEEEEDKKTRKSSVDPMKMQFFAHKMHEHVERVLQTVGTVHLEEGLLTIQCHSNMDMEEVRRFAEAELQKLADGVVSISLPLSKDLIEQAMNSENQKKEIMDLYVIIVYDPKMSMFKVYGLTDATNIAHGILKRYEGKRGEDLKCVTIKGLTPFRFKLFYHFEKARIRQNFPRFVFRELEEQNFVQIEGPETEISEFKRCCMEFEPCQIRSVVETGKAELLLRGKVQEHVCRLLVENKVDAVWRIVDSNLEVYASDKSEAKKAFQTIESNIICVPLDKKTVQTKLFQDFFKKNESVVLVCNVEGKCILSTLQGVYIEYLDQMSIAISSEIDANKQLHLEASGQMKNEQRVKRKNLDLEEYNVLQHFCFPQYLKKKTDSKLMCTMDPHHCQIEFIGTKENIDGSLQILDEFKRQIHKECLEMACGQYLLMGMKECFDYVQSVINPSVMTPYYIFLCINGDKSEVHIFSRSKQELSQVGSILETCIQVRDVVVTENEKKMLKSTEWKQFAEKCKGKMLVDGDCDKDAEIGIFITSDLVNEMDGILQRCHDRSTAKQMVLDTSRKEFALASATVSDMEKQCNVKLELQTKWIPEKYLILGEPAKCYKMLTRFWENFSRNSLDLFHSVEVDFIHSIEGQKCIEDLQEKMSCVVSVNSDEWYEEPLHVYDFLNKEKAVHVSLMKGSTENMKVDVMVIPINTSGYPVFGRDILLKKERRGIISSLTDELKKRKQKIGYHIEVIGTRNIIPCEVMVGLVVESTLKENKNSFDKLRESLSQIISDAGKRGWKSLAIPLYMCDGSNSTDFVKEIASLLDQFLNFTYFQIAQSAITLSSSRSDGVSEIYVCSEDIRIIDTLKSIMWKKLVSSSSIEMYDFSSLLPKGIWTRKPNREERAAIKTIFKEGSLADEKADLLVNTVNTGLNLGRGGISKTLLNRGGKVIQEECDKQKREKNFTFGFGDVIFTSGGDGRLKCSAIAHGALPKWNPTTGLSLRVIKKIMWQCLKYADKFAFSSVAFPPFGTGTLAYPRTRVAKAMMECVQDYQKETPETSVSEVRVCLYSGDQDTVKSFINTLETSSMEKNTPELLPSLVPQTRIQMSSGTVQVQVIPNDVLSVTQCEAVFDILTGQHSQRVEGEIITKFDSQARYVIGSINAGNQDDEFKLAVRKCLNAANRERHTAVALSISQDGNMKDKLSMIRDTISSHGPIIYLQIVYVLYDRRYSKRWIEGLCLKEESRGIFGASKVPSMWKEVKFHYIGEEESQVKISIFGRKEKAAQAQAFLESELDQLFYDDQKQVTESAAVFSSKKKVAASDDIRTGESSKVEKQQKTAFAKRQKSEEMINVIVEKLQATECEFKALQFYCEGEFWQKSFQVEWRENNIIFSTEGAIDEVKKMLEVKLDYIRKMNKLDFLITVSPDKSNENIKEEINRIMVEENKSNSSSGTKIFSFLSTEGKCLHLYGATYEMLLNIKHKVGVALGMHTKPEGRRRRRFVSDSDDSVPSNKSEPKTVSDDDKHSSQSEKRRNRGFVAGIADSEPKTVINDERHSFQSEKGVPKLDLNKPFTGTIKSEFTTTEGLKIKIYQESILKVNVECIVNAANGTLSHGGGVAYVISKAAGYEFDKESRDYVATHGSIKDGECCITSAGKLQYKNVIHTVGPRWSSYGKDQCLALLRKSVVACFYMADKHGIRSIALPAISSGIFGVPKDYCVQEYFNGVIQYSQTKGSSSTLQEIHFIDQDMAMVSIIKTGFSALFSSKMIPSTNSPTSQQPLSPSGKSHTNRSNRFSKNPEVTDQQMEKSPEPPVKRYIYKFWVKDKKDRITMLVYKGDLLAVETDAIVCPQDKSCSNQTQIAKELLKRGNSSYQSAVKDWKSVEKPGAYKVTDCRTFDSFPFKHVLHAVAPRWGDGGKLAFENEIRSTMFYLFKKIKEMSLQSIGLPLIGIGRKGFQESATKFAEELTRQVRHLTLEVYPHPLKEVHVLCVDEQGATVIKDALTKNPDLVGEVEVVEPVKTPQSTNQPVPMETDKDTASRTGEEIDCCICMDVCTDPKRLNCGHVFCSGCIAQQFSYKPSCPQCGAVYGKMTGNQPPGRVSINTSRRPLPGYTDCGSIEINYDIPAGYQREDHPSPGTMYEGINRSGHLPDTSKGRLVCKLLNVAFTRKLIFTIGHSRTTGKDGVVTWNDIHHKTRREGGPQRFGYPDKTYLDRVMEELTVKGVTEDSVDQDEHEEYTKAFSEHW